MSLFIMYIYIYTYTYIWREREREMYMYMSMYVSPEVSTKPTFSDGEWEVTEEARPPPRDQTRLNIRERLTWPNSVICLIINPTANVWTFYFG